MQVLALLIQKIYWLETDEISILNTEIYKISILSTEMHKTNILWKEIYEMNKNRELLS